MHRKTIEELLRGNHYPGRGILIGNDQEGRSLVAYFIMGRSENSRNRIFVEEEDGLRTQARDPEKMQDPSLIIYHPVRRLEDRLIVTNGDQTDTVLTYLKEGKSFEEALHSRSFEPDGPNWTPRISGLLEGDGSYRLSILKAADPEGVHCLRYFFSYPAISGTGHLIHTYQTDGSPLPSFVGEPHPVEISGGIDDLTERIWSALDEDNKISLFVQSIDRTSGLVNRRMINKYEAAGRN